FEFFVLFQEPYHRLERFIASNTQAACHTRRRLVGRTVVTQRAPAADKLHTGHAFGALPAAYRNQPHLTRTPRMRTTAWRPIEVGDFNNAHTIGIKSFLAQRQLCGLCWR